MWSIATQPEVPRTKAHNWETVAHEPCLHINYYDVPIFTVATFMMSQFIEVPIKSLKLQHPLKYPQSALESASAKLRNSSVSVSLKDNLQKPPLCSKAQSKIHRTFERH